MAITVYPSSAGYNFLYGGGNRTGETSTSATWNTNIVSPTATPLVAGKVAMVGVVCDNAATGGASPVSGVTDDAGNTFTLVVSATQSPGSTANDGVTTELWVAPIQAKSTTVTVSYSTSTTAKVISGCAFSGTNATPYSSNSVTGSGTTYNSGATATASMASGDVVVGLIGTESATIPTLDTDTTRGSWLGITATQAGGSGTTTVASTLTYKIVNASGTQTLNGTNPNADWAVVWGLFSVEPVVFGYNINQSVARAATR